MKRTYILLVATLLSIHVLAGSAYAQNSLLLREDNAGLNRDINNGSISRSVNDITENYYTFVSKTGGSYSILIDLATIEEDSVENGDEVGVFDVTASGDTLCVGATVFAGSYPLGLTAWIDNSQTSEQDGYVPGHTMIFKIYEASSGIEYHADAAYVLGNGAFGNGAYARISALTSFIVVSENNPPVITEMTDTTIYEGDLFTRQVYANDADGDTLIYILVSSPAGMKIGSSSGEINWTPDFDQSDDYTVTVKVEDGKGGEDTKSFLLAVININRAPVLLQIGNKEVSEGDTLTFIVSATDDDGDSLIFSVEDLPVGATFDSTNGDFYWAPTYEQSGIYNPTFSVTDNGSPPLSDSETIAITVNNVNRAPVITAMTDTTVNEGDLFTRQVYANDPDGDTLTYSLDLPPSGMTINSSSGEINWTPDFDQSDYYTVNVKVVDGKGGEDSKSFSLIVVNVERELTIIAYSPELDTVITECDSVEFSVEVMYYNTSTIYYMWYYDDVSIQSGMASDSTITALIHFPFGSTGTHSVKAVVTDSKVFADITWNITVQEKIWQTNEPIIIKFPEDTSSITLNFDHNSSLTVNFTSGDVANKTLTITQYTDIAANFPNVPGFNNSIAYFYISLNAKNFSAELTFSYSDSLLNILGIDEDSLAVCFYDSIDARGFMWHLVPAAIDKINNTITLTTDHFSLWAITSKGEELITHVNEPARYMPDGFTLFQNYPNPFNPETIITFQIPRSSFVTLKIYNTTGQLIKTLVSENVIKGIHSVSWDGLNDSGKQVSSGMYIYLIQAGNFSAAKKLILVK